MTSRVKFVGLRSILLGATSVAAAAVMATTAQAQERPTYSEESPAIIVNNNLNPNTPPPGGVFDSADVLLPDGTRGSGVTIGLATGVNGVGQMTVRPDPASTGLSLCTGTLINPRTVLFAAHCVNDIPAQAYGKNGVAADLNPNGTPIAFGFGANNLPAVRQWLGLASAPGAGDANPALINATNAARALYSVEQVWYDPRSLGPNSFGFLEADVALATLDTPAFGVPTWTMLFSPLTEQTHAISTGYGVNGTSASAQGPGPCTEPNCGTLGSIDFRRRAVENLVSVLGSLDDRDDFLFGDGSPGSGGGTNPQSLYMQDFDSPAGEAAYSPGQGRFDFDLFNGAALPREGTTAGGDSGGPLIVDQKFSKPVIVGDLSGGSRFFNGQRFGTYGTHNFYQPLFLFWDVIVANNSYVYAGTKAGSGAWEDATRWVQLMDPNYAIERNGALVNGLPDTPALGVSGDTVKFGEVCFLSDCTNLADDDTATAVPVGSGTGLVIAGGPGSTNFVPDNVVANPKMGIKARYYDVTLSNRGTTSLSSTKTIDRFALDGGAKLDVKTGSGTLKVLGEYTQWSGTTNVDGSITSGGDALFATGLLSGKGTFKAPFITLATATVAPGGVGTIGTLKLDGNAILSSGSTMFIELDRSGADKLTVTGSLLLSQNNLGQGPTLAVNRTSGVAPRDGQSFTIATSSALTGTFGRINSSLGVLRPELTYTSTSVIANLRAGSLVLQVGQAGPTQVAFASALDQLRGSSYTNLYDLYGAVDLMDSATLSRTLAGLAPTAIATETLMLQDKQSKVMLSAVSDRLSMLGTGSSRGTLSIVGAPGAVAALTGSRTGQSQASLANYGGSRSFTGGTRAAMALPETMSGFISGGVSNSGSSYGNNRLELAGQRSWNVGMGLEVEVAEGTMLGTALAFSSGLGLPGGESARVDSRTTQVAVYGSHQFGSGAYVAGLAAADRSRTGIERQAFTGEALDTLTGATEASRYSAMLETGVNVGVAKGLTLTPRMSLGYSSYTLSGFRETGGVAALRLDDLKLNRVDAKFGAKFAGAAPLGHSGWTLVPQIQTDWVKNLSGARSGMTVRFAAAPDAAIALPLFEGDTSWVEMKGGMRLTNGAIEFGAGVERNFGRQSFRDDRAVADVTLRF